MAATQRQRAGDPQRVEGTVLTPTGWVRGAVDFNERITAVHGEPAKDLGSEPVILPGFIDLHVHGGGGADIMDGQDAAATLARFYVHHGTTSLLATTLTASRSDLEQALAGARGAVRQRPAGGARVLGVHLEGPFINPGKLGVQPNSARAGSLEELKALNEIVPIRVVTLAPELPGHLDLIRAMSAAGFIPQIGHTLGSYQDGVAALEAGARGFTHLFNAMTPMHHRQPGMVAAALAHAEYSELIPDLLHVHPGAIRTALRAIPRLYCVTDSTAATGMSDGTYHLGAQTVTRHHGSVRLADGTLAGSMLTMDEALRNLVSIGVPLEEASRRTSTLAAEYLGIEDRGRLAPGCWADLIVLSPALEISAVFVEGESIELDAR